MSPSYGFETDAVHFHTTPRDWCGRHELGRYQDWKQACDEYLTAAHRNKMRGIGGIFFDRLAEPAEPFPPAAIMARRGDRNHPTGLTPRIAGDSSRWLSMRYGMC